MASIFIPIPYDREFTLIELLIVIAIILILIAIALPNFIEAQIRAKVAKAAGDIRSLATGMESYLIDWNSYTNDCPGLSDREPADPTGPFPVSGAGVPWTVYAPTNGTKSFGGIMITGGVSFEHPTLRFLNQLTHL